MAESPVRVHSVAEAFLFVMVRPCPACARGPLTASGGITRVSDRPNDWQLSVQCKACRTPKTLAFTIDPVPSREGAASSQINPTPHRSEAIDLLGWLTLYRTILSSVKSAPDAAEARHLAAEAAQCLDEAMKFYALDNDLPPADAFYTEASRLRFADHPEQFARSRWLEERLRLPATTPLATDSPPAKRRSWWPFGRRG